VVILTSDHGEEFLEHKKVLHSELYRTVTHVPLLIRLPGGEGGGRRVSKPVGLIDLLPTLLELAGIESPVPMSGSSLVPLIEGRGDQGEGASRYVFSDFPDFGDLVSVLDDRYHLVGNLTDDRWELFDYRSDVLEQKDLSEERPDLVDSLRTVIFRWREEIQDRVEAENQSDDERVELDEATREELKALGYIE